MKAIWNDKVVAESNETIVIEGNHYFPPDSIRMEYFRESRTHTTCSWKGETSYYDIVVSQEVNPGSAWYYPKTKEAARRIKGYAAFWRGINVIE